MGLDAENVKGELQEKDLLLRHIASIDAMGPHMARALKVFIPEVNYGMPDHLPNMLIGTPNLEIWTDPRTGRMGVWKQKTTAEQYRFAVSNALYHSSVRIDENVFTCTQDEKGRVPVDKMVHTLRNQLERYRYVRRDAHDDFGVTKVKLSGKSGGENDDLVMTFMMCVAWGTAYLLNPKTREKLRHATVGGTYIEVTAENMVRRPNATVERQKEDAAKEAAHDARFAQRVSSRVQMARYV